MDTPKLQAQVKCPLQCIEGFGALRDSGARTVKPFRGISEVSTKTSMLKKLSEQAFPKRKVRHDKMGCPIGVVERTRRDRIAMYQAAP